MGLLALAALGLSQEAPPDPLLNRIYQLLTSKDLSPFGSGIGLALGALGMILAAALAFLLGFGLRDAYKRRKARVAKRIFKTGQNSAASTTAILLAALALFLGLRYGSAYLSGLQDEAAKKGAHSEAQVLPDQAAGPAHEATELDEGDQSSIVFSRLTALAFFTGIGAFLARLAYIRIRSTKAVEQSGDGSAEGSLARGLARARRRLRIGDRDADAIIDCYADMCELFQRGDDKAQKPLSAALTAREFEALLRARGVGEGHIHTLTLLFEKARYSGLACDSQDRLRAAEALYELETRYSGAGPSPMDSSRPEISAHE